MTDRWPRWQNWRRRGTAAGLVFRLFSGRFQNFEADQKIFICQVRTIWSGKAYGFQVRKWSRNDEQSIFTGRFFRPLTWLGRRLHFLLCLPVAARCPKAKFFDNSAVDLFRFRPARDRVTGTGPCFLFANAERMQFLGTKISRQIEELRICHGKTEAGRQRPADDEPTN